MLRDAALLMFDKLMGGLARKSERRTMESAAGALRDAQGHLRVLARAGRAVIAAHEVDADPVAAVELAVGWVRFLQPVAEAEDLARPETVDVRAELDPAVADDATVRAGFSRRLRHSVD